MRSKTKPSNWNFMKRRAWKYVSYLIFGVVKSWRLSAVAIFAREKNYFAVFKKTKVVRLLKYFYYLNITVKSLHKNAQKQTFRALSPRLFMFGMSALLVLFIIFCSGLILSIDPSSIIITLVLLVLELLKPPVSLLFRIIIRTMVTRNTVVDRIFVRFGKTSALLRSLQYLYASLVRGPRKITVPWSA